MKSIITKWIYFVDNRARKTSPSTCFSRCSVNLSEIISQYNWIEGACDCSDQCNIKNQSVGNTECCIDYNDYCLAKIKVNGTRFEAFVQSLGLEHSYVKYIGIVLLCIIVAIISFFVYRQRHRPLQIKQICDAANGSLLEMTSSASSSNDRSQMMHWDDVYGDFIDFNLAETRDQQLLQIPSLSMYRNTDCNEDWQTRQTQMEEICLEEKGNDSKGK